jgi:P4 family phage/plasmid primase-like protien
MSLITKEELKSVKEKVEYTEEQKKVLLDKWKIDIDNFKPKESPKIVLMSKFSPVEYANTLKDISKFILDKNKVFWRYDSKEGIWKDDAEQFIKTYLRNNLMGDEQQKEGYVREIVLYLKDSSWRPEFEPNKNPNLIAFNNKIYDLEHDCFVEFNSNHFITNKIRIDIDDKITECPVIDKFFTDSVGEKYKITLYEIISYMLFRSNPYQKLFFIYGRAKTGKSQYLKLAEKFIGTDNCSTIEPQYIQKDKHSTYIMWNKLANIVSDINYDALDNINQIKKLTGGDSVNIRRMHHEGFMDTLYAKQLFSTNKLPVVKEKTMAWYRRAYILPFENVVADTNRDPFIIEKMTTKEEMMGFAWKCIKTLRKLYENKFLFTWDIKEEEMAKIYEELSNPILSFTKENCTEDESGYCYIFEFKDRLNAWLKDNHFPPMTAIQINTYMKDKYSSSQREAPFDKQKDNEMPKMWRVWLGLRFKTKEDNVATDNQSNQSNQSNQCFEIVYVYRGDNDTPLERLERLDCKKDDIQHAKSLKDEDLHIEHIKINKKVTKGENEKC